MKVHGKSEEAIFTQICESYAEGTPLDESISRSGWSVLQFYKYMAEDVGREALFQSAKDQFTGFYESNLVTKALISFEKLITGFTEVEYEEEFIPKYEGGKEVSRVIKKRVEKTKYFPPNPLTVMFALEKLIPKKYSQPSKLLPEAPKSAELQVYKLGDQIIKF